MEDAEAYGCLRPLPPSPWEFLDPSDMAEFWKRLGGVPLEDPPPSLAVRPRESCLGSSPVVSGDRSNSDCLSPCED